MQIIDKLIQEVFERKLKAQSESMLSPKFNIYIESRTLASIKQDLTDRHMCFAFGLNPSIMGYPIYEVSGGHHAPWIIHQVK